MSFFPHHSFFPKGEPTDLFDKKASGPFSSDLQNAVYRRDMYLKIILYCLGIMSICVISTVLIATTWNYKTYVVRVDSATGQVETGGQLKATNYEPQQAEIKHFLSQFIQQTRTVPLDPVQYKNNWDTAQHYLTREAAQKMTSLMKQDNPTAKLGHITVQPIIRAIQLQPGQHSTYQVRWTEEEFSISGSLTGKKENYVALFQIEVQPPTKEEELLINPLGLKIKDLSIAHEQESKDKN